MQTSTSIIATQTSDLPACGLCLIGHGEQAQVAVARVLEFNPDSTAARGMLKQLESGAANCTAK